MLHLESNFSSENEVEHAPTLKKVSLKEFVAEVTTPEYGRTMDEREGFEALLTLFDGWMVECDLNFMTIEFYDADTLLHVSMSVASNNPCTYVRMHGMESKVWTSKAAFEELHFVIKNLKQNFDMFSSLHGQ